GVYQATNSVNLATNTLLRIASFGATSNLTGGTITIQYPGTLASFVDLSTALPSDYINLPVLGPATTTVRLTATSASAAGFFLLQFDSANTSPIPGGGIVEPAGFNGTVALQASTNLTTWTTLTNATFGSTNVNRFFRMQLTLP